METHMKPLSLDELIAIENNTILHSDITSEKLGLFLRLLHTAREYHRMRAVLEEIAQPEKSDHQIEEEAYFITMLAREALKEGDE